MRSSWIVAGALFVLTWLFASMELGFLALASFVLLVITAMAGHYRPETLAMAHSPEQKHSQYGSERAYDPNHSEGAKAPSTAHSPQHHSERPHPHFSQGHSEKKHSDFDGHADAQSEKKRSGRSHSEKGHGYGQRAF